MADYRVSNSNQTGRYSSGGRDNSRSNRDEYGYRGERGYDRGSRDGDYHRGGRSTRNRYGHRQERETSYNIDDKIREIQVQEHERKQEHSKDKDTSAEDDVSPRLTPEEIQRREEYLIPIETFDNLGNEVDLKIIRGVMAYGFEKPSPIQSKSIHPILQGFDLIAQAQSGCLSTFIIVIYSGATSLGLAQGGTVLISMDLVIGLKMWKVKVGSTTLLISPSAGR